MRHLPKVRSGAAPRSERMHHMRHRRRLAASGRLSRQRQGVLGVVTGERAEAVRPRRDGTESELHLHKP